VHSDNYYLQPQNKQKEKIQKPSITLPLLLSFSSSPSLQRKKRGRMMQRKREKMKRKKYIILKKLFLKCFRNFFF